ncbi:hypothetical protein BVRB_3g065280 [Beta vulgaris subsp. vulgaris]|uniref:Uncharacterized protein n=1 Tax=Beta vulgaris subsp. vulgaris TaxID=3555 RepID=A0A0J8CMP5_BETVV|nr:hypothetical protein BVRB_3g065280 [Beta vulgaris subsp. vulgaris]
MKGIVVEFMFVINVDGRFQTLILVLGIGGLIRRFVETLKGISWIMMHKTRPI